MFNPDYDFVADAERVLTEFDAVPERPSPDREYRVVVRRPYGLVLGETEEGMVHVDVTRHFPEGETIPESDFSADNIWYVLPA